MKTNILSNKKDWYTLFCMFAFAICLAIPFLYTIPLRFIPLWWLVAFHFSFCVNLINHNHAHVPTFTNKKMNYIMDMALTLLRGASAIFIKIIHNINHHHHEGSPDDWFSPINEGQGTVIDRTINYIFVTARRFKNGATDYYAKMGPEFKNQQTVERILLFTFTVSLVIIDIKAFLGFVLPAWIFGNFFLVYTNLIFHKNARHQDKLTNSYNFLNPLENWIYFNGGYHTIHHLHPNLHWSELPKAHKNEIEDVIQPQYVKGSMYVHMFRHVLRQPQA
jgi:beta-carotene hydroxylase